MSGRDVDDRAAARVYRGANFCGPGAAGAAEPAGRRAERCSNRIVIAAVTPATKIRQAVNGEMGSFIGAYVFMSAAPRRNFAVRADRAQARRS